MTDKERFSDYIESLTDGNGIIFENIRKKALLSHIPIIRRETEELLKTLIVMKKPARILEVGTAVGYSALVMALVMPKDSHIDTIEKDSKRVKAAQINIRDTGYDDSISIIEGDAGDVLEKLNGKYDFVFMDAAKGQYINWFETILDKTGEDAILVSDNCMQEGTVLSSRYLVTRRDRTIHTRMRDYLYILTHRDDISTCILPVGDGVSISIKKGKIRKNEEQKTGTAYSSRQPGSTENSC